MKFKDGLLREYEKTRAEEIHQEDLRNKYDVTDQNVLVVEKPSGLKYFTKLIVGIISVLWTIIRLCLIFIGILALIYPQTRAGLYDELQLTFEQLMGYLG